MTTAWIAAVTPEVSASESTIPIPRPTSTIRSSSLALTKLSFVTSQAQTICTPMRRLPTQPSPAYATPSSAITPMLPRLSITDCTAWDRVSPSEPGTFSLITSSRRCWRSALFASTKPATEAPSRTSGKIARKLK